MALTLPLTGEEYRLSPSNQISKVAFTRAKQL